MRHTHAVLLLSLGCYGPPGASRPECCRQLSSRLVWPASRGAGSCVRMGEAAEDDRSCAGARARQGYRRARAARGPPETGCSPVANPRYLPGPRYGMRWTRPCAGSCSAAGTGSSSAGWSTGTSGTPPPWPPCSGGRGWPVVPRSDADRARACAELAAQLAAGTAAASAVLPRPTDISGFRRRTPVAS
jgi:hypothetical protein